LELIIPEWVKQKILFYPAGVMSILPNPSIHGLKPVAINFQALCHR
jgi:hypothetical protein